MTPKIKYPFEVPFSEIEASVEVFVDSVFDTLQSSFLLLPRGPGFVTYPNFQQAYEVLKRHTVGFTSVEQENVLAAPEEEALAFVVLRTMLGFTPPELAYVATSESGISVSQNFARTLDRRVRSEPRAFGALAPQNRQRALALVSTA